ncbi:hypothetical protein N7U66_11725 [Lacinutrix neustonica]|uniref:Uncharacterized protein n=1 Tax=Lacinutrix neustonica TaxID=2980107 RepID=A0A9E8SD65_9FLAO|nr:hypothetical protein [Lacinutrix neustonica]WAC00904.1 hypothetical protein N7U66_11725 [Lacinutrix neustonica]
MNKKTGYLLGVFLTIILGIILYYFLCCKSCWDAQKAEAKTIVVGVPEVENTSKNRLSIIDSKSGIAFKAKDNFNFRTSDFSIVTPLGEGLVEEVSKLARFINDNSKKGLDITGYYSIGEENTTAFPNLGLAELMP